MRAQGGAAYRSISALLSIFKKKGVIIMGKFHSTVSRRTFMKGLGLAGAGIGAAAAAAPVFHDLDEVSSPTTPGR
jgi:histidinol-phosphate/aromatic aminotransferase/cobyric acid decarboxylase-like protein